jgi:hypothetical protein
MLKEFLEINHLERPNERILQAFALVVVRIKLVILTTETTEA